MATEEAVKAEPAAAVPPPTPTTHPTGFFFLFAGEFAERFSYYGMRAILPLYMSDQMGFGEGAGGRYYTFFMAACYLLPLVGGYIADNFFGKYWTIVGFSIPYILGHLILGIENPYAMTAALGLLAMGTGVIKPNISTLLGMTYDQFRPGQLQLRTGGFQYFYMAINIGAFIAQVTVPVIRDQTGSYAMAFAVPTVFMVVALGFFAAGKKYYATEVIDRNRPPEPPEQTVAKIRVLSQVGLLFALVSFFWAVFDQSSYTWVFFAKTYMDLNILGVALAPDSIQALNPFFIVLFIGGAGVYRTFTATDTTKVGMAATTKMLIGFVLTAVCMGIMAVAGYLTGDTEKAVQVKCKEVEIFLPFGTATLSGGTIDQAKGKFTNTGGSVAFPSPDGVKGLTFSKYGSSSGGKVAFEDGELTLADGKKLVFTGGMLDFVKSRDVFADGKIALPGALEYTFRQGKYQLPDGVLVITRGNQAEILKGETLKVPPAKQEDPAVSISTGKDAKYVKPENRVSVWWMALAFFVITIAEILISVTGLELAFVVAPPSMKSFITACWLLTVFVANAFINAPIADLYPEMHPGNYFLMLTIVGLVVAALFVPVSRRFNRAMAAAQAERDATPPAEVAEKVS